MSGDLKQFAAEVAWSLPKDSALDWRTPDLRPRDPHHVTTGAEEHHQTLADRLPLIS